LLVRGAPYKRFGPTDNPMSFEEDVVEALRLADKQDSDKGVFACAQGLVSAPFPFPSMPRAPLPPPALHPPTRAPARASLDFPLRRPREQDFTRALCFCLPCAEGL
jgi:hypothetical protein